LPKANQLLAGKKERSMKNASSKYLPFPPVCLPDRQWPNRIITCAPIWCSVDLRDGNQALASPMRVEQKLEFFKEIVRIGFKEIEVGFPGASNTEFAFMRLLIEGGYIPDDVTVQVLTMSRKKEIEDTINSLVGAKKVIIHMYNSTSPVQRRVVFGKSKEEIIEIAVSGVQMIKDRLHRIESTDVRLQYSPESFNSTELDFVLEVCEAVTDVWQPTMVDKIILNLPVTVEYATPNIYADQIEWMCKHLTRRNLTIVSVHVHNDRGTAVAATELAILAGADRVEGTLFGNGERTGNADLITLALNMYTQGIDLELDFSDINMVREVYERTTRLEVSPRHPYAGDLVCTAFSGSHQDAIKKTLAAQEEGKPWEVLYLSFDPGDIGRSYDVIRVNSQSGKAGVAYLLEEEFGIFLPKDLQREFGAIASKRIDDLGCEVDAKQLYVMFCNEYVNHHDSFYVLKSFNYNDNQDCCIAVLSYLGEEYELSGSGSGPIEAFVCSLRNACLVDIHVLNQSQHTLGVDEKAHAIAYIKLQFSDKSSCWGVEVDTSITLASIRAIVSALNRSMRSA